MTPSVTNDPTSGDGPRHPESSSATGWPGVRIVKRGDQLEPIGAQLELRPIIEIIETGPPDYRNYRNYRKRLRNYRNYRKRLRNYRKTRRNYRNYRKRLRNYRKTRRNYRNYRKRGRPIIEIIEIIENGAARL